MTSALPFRARAFGVQWASDVELHHFAADPVARTVPDVTIAQIDAMQVRQPVGAVNRGMVFSDGFRLSPDALATFEMIDGLTIGYVPHANWRGALPARFYSTVTALTLAWRGAIPMHASAVAIDGRAVLLCGATGAGKSTLTAGLLAQGAEFIGDDLTVLSHCGEGQPPCVERGRTTMRLHPDTAHWVPTAKAEPDTRDERGKWLVEPARQADRWQWPIAAFVLLGADNDADNRGRLKARVARQMFRPRWLEALPDHASRVAGLFSIAADVPVIGLPKVAIENEADLRAAGTRALDSIRSAIG